LPAYTVRLLTAYSSKPSELDATDFPLLSPSSTTVQHPQIKPFACHTRPRSERSLPTLTTSALQRFAPETGYGSVSFPPISAPCCSESAQQSGLSALA